MPGLENEIDANFFCMIHQLMHGDEDENGEDRRGNERSLKADSHRVAPYDGVRFPVAAAFVPVETYDLARSGFSFFFDELPDFRRLMVNFGTEDSPLHVEAEVRHCEPVIRHSAGQVEYLPEESEDAASTGSAVLEQVHLVGCRFVRRLGS